MQHRKHTIPWPGCCWSEAHSPIFGPIVDGAPYTLQRATATRALRDCSSHIELTLTPGTTTASRRFTGLRCMEIAHFASCCCSKVRNVRQ